MSIGIVVCACGQHALGFWFLVCYNASPLALKLLLFKRIQVVRTVSSRVAQKCRPKIERHSCIGPWTYEYCIEVVLVVTSDSFFVFCKLSHH